jgi:uncharacterized protein (DUF433 family)
MTVAAITHIKLDAQGKAWIDDTNVKVIEVVEDWLAHHQTAEEMHEDYPHLSVAQIHAALAYYYDHKEEFDAEIERGWQEFQALRAAAGESPGRKKLRALGYLP